MGSLIKVYAPAIDYNLLSDLYISQHDNLTWREEEVVCDHSHRYGGDFWYWLCEQEYLEHGIIMLKCSPESNMTHPEWICKILDWIYLQVKDTPAFNGKSVRIAYE